MVSAILGSGVGMICTILNVLFFLLLDDMLMVNIVLRVQMLPQHHRDVNYNIPLDLLITICSSVLELKGSTIYAIQIFTDR